MIVQEFIPAGRKNRPGWAMAPKYLTIHDTGNTNRGATAPMHARYLKGDTAANLPVSWHYTVDDKVIVQHLPTTEIGWHAGDGGQGPGNRKSIGIEICMDTGGDRVKAEANAIWLVAELVGTVATLKPFPGCMKQHYDWSGKNCPQLIRAGRHHNWSSFLDVIKKEIEGGPEPMAGKYFKDVPDDAWFASAVNGLYEQGLIGGYEDGTFKPSESLTRAEAAALIHRLYIKLRSG